jgi:hypothetical protein
VLERPQVLAASYKLEPLASDHVARRDPIAILNVYVALQF